MADIRPFRAVRFDPRRVPLSRALCPPYDVIDAERAAALRREERNAVHLELPEGGRDKYALAARRWERWLREGWLVQDDAAAFYVVEERFRAAGRLRARTGFLAALSVKPEHARFVIAHEHTLAKPKKDRLRLLGAVRANISPIFGLLPDPSGAARRALKRAKSGRPLASGRLAGVGYRLWAMRDAGATAALAAAARPARLLIADGHHRYEVSRAYYRLRPSAGAQTVLAYLCPEEDAGLVVLPTHRIVADRLARADDGLTPSASRAALLRALERSRDPYAFGLYEEGRYWLGEPGRDGCRSGLCVEWLGRRLLRRVPPDRIAYTPDAARAEALARRQGGAAVFVKPMAVSQIRRAVSAIGLLPPKSTYFYPKIATGLAFKSF